MITFLRSKIKALCFLLFSLYVLAASASTHENVRFITLSPHLAEWVAEASAIDYLVGVSKFTDYPISTQKLPIVADAFQISLETILKLNPTHILAWKEGTPKKKLNSPIFQKE
jgi:ABC-type hemin transport system substrate-binding protein